MKTQKIFSRVLDVLILFVFILYFASAGFQDRNTSGWYQQWFPNLNGSTIQDITFLDSLTGFAVTNPGTSIYCYILKTTNGGDNWVINYTHNSGTNIRFTRIQFADNNTGYVSNNFYNFFKTTDKGQTWFDYFNVPFGAEDMSVINKDSILVVTSRGLGGGVYRSTNGGISWQYIWNNSPNGNPDKIYMYDKNLGFTQNGSNYMRRTTNGGFNWDFVSGEFFSGMEFVDSLIGWKAHIGVQKTTNGGLNWINQQLPNISSSYIDSKVDIVNKNTVRMVGARKYKRAPVYKTTDGGINWGYQIPDTSYPVYSYNNIQFENFKFGWVFTLYGTDNILFHTTTGGNDTTFFTGIKLVPNIVPEKFSLGQNYPNPFNPSTNIPYELKEPSHVTLKVYDVQGKEVKELVNGRWGTGKFMADFDGAEFSTGVYFYKIVLYGESSKQTFSETKRMLLLK